MTTTIHFCICEHKFQDATYGEGKRVFNIRPKKKSWECTVCGRNKPATDDEIKASGTSR